MIAPFVRYPTTSTGRTLYVIRNSQTEVSSKRPSHRRRHVVSTQTTSSCLSFFCSPSAWLAVAMLFLARLMPTLMKAFRSFTSVVGIVVCICGCATSGTDRVVQIGPNTYKMGGLGKSTDFSGSAVKARLYQQAAEFCRSKGGEMIPLNSTAQDSKPGQYASAEIRFKCVPASR